MYEYKLPIAGERFVKLDFCGNGKDSEVTIEVEGQREIVIPLDDATMDINVSSAVTIRTRGHGDPEVVIEIVPAADQPVMVGEASVHFLGSEDEWNQYCQEDTDRGGSTELSCCVSLRLRLVTADG
jgi:hypothetical protein